MEITLERFPLPLDTLIRFISICVKRRKKDSIIKFESDSFPSRVSILAKWLVAKENNTQTEP